MARVAIEQSRAEHDNGNSAGRKGPICSTVEELRRSSARKSWPVRGREDQDCRSVNLDSRSIQSDLFVAIKGTVSTGMILSGTALSRGCGAAASIPTIRVGCPGQERKKRTPLLILAFAIRSHQQLATPPSELVRHSVVAVTGSNGKTTTKEMVASVMAYRWVLATEGNLNNRTGVPDPSSPQRKSTR